LRKGLAEAQVFFYAAASSPKGLDSVRKMMMNGLFFAIPDGRGFCLLLPNSSWWMGFLVGIDCLIEGITPQINQPTYAGRELIQ
jgi:hypothetical protein